MRSADPFNHCAAYGLTLPWPEDESFVMFTAPTGTANAARWNSSAAPPRRARRTRTCRPRRARGQKPARRPAFSRDGTSSAKRSGFAGRGLRLQDLAAAIHPGLQVDVMGTAQLARILVFDISRSLEGVGRAAHAAARRGGFASGDGHWCDSDRARAFAFAARGK